MTRIFRYIATIAAAAALAFAVTGCTMPQASAPEGEDPVAANRQYMSSLNQMSVELTEKLDAFSDAVSRNDTVGMRTQADNAYKVIDDMRAVEAPDDLKDLKDGYMEACDGLKEALDGYIGLYEAVAAEGASLDAAQYNQRIQGIQEGYDSAVSKLKETDEHAAELQR